MTRVVALLASGLALLSLLSPAPVLAQTSQDYFLHGSGGTANPPTLFLDTTAPIGGTAKYKDSTGVNFSGGNPWKEVGTWPTTPVPASGTLVAVAPATVWLGLKNSDDQGTNFDLLVELYKNGSLVSSGLNRCITGITRNPSLAKEVSVVLSSPGSQPLNGSTDTLSLKVWTRIGTNPDDTKCAGHNNAVGLRLYFDANTRLSLVGLTITPNPIPTTLAPDPLTITVGATGTLTATIAPAPTADGTLAVSSANTGIATVPATVAFVSGQTSVPIPVTAVAVGNTQITASLNGGSATATVQVTPAPPTVTSLQPPSLNLTQGATGTLTVTISSAQLSDTVVTLSSTAPGIASVPSTVTVPTGQVSAPVTVTANTPGTAQITASLNGTSASSMVTVAPAQATIVSLLPPTNPVTLGGTVTLTVTISATQPTDSVIAVSASPAGIVTVPASVTVPAGQLSAPITVGTVALGTAMVHVDLNGSMAEATVQVTPPPPAVVSLTPSPLTVVVNATGQLTVTLNAAQATNTQVTLTVDNPSVLQVPASVTVPMNQLSATFTVTGLAVGDAIVTASVGSSSQSATVHVIPPPPVPVSLLPNPLPLQQGATGTLTLTISSAQVSDTVVPLTNSDAAVIQVPSSVTVPAGQTTAAVPVTALIVGTATVSATLNGTTVTSTVQVTEPPPVVTSLTPTTLSLPKGKPGVLRVTVSRAPTEPTPVTLTSSVPGVATVPASVTIPAGALFADFPVMSLSEGTAIITASLNGGSAQSTVTVTPAEVVSLTLTPTNPAIYVGESQQFTATATFTDGTTQNLTNTVTWTSETETVATINSGGIATGLAVGTTTITASYTNLSGPPAITASTTLTVNPPPQMQLIPSSASLQVGENLSLTLDAGAPANTGGLAVTLSATGSGSVTHPATVTVPEGDTQIPFTVTGVTAGPVTLTASATGRQSTTATLTILAPPPTFTGFSPVSGNLGTLVTLTGSNFSNVQSVTFNGVPSSNVTVVNATTILATVPVGATSGVIAVTTASGTQPSTATFTVITLTALAVSPTPVTLPAETSQPLRATATFADQNSRDVTTLVAWNTSNAGIVSVSSGGVAQGVAPGTAAITATLGSFNAASSILVVSSAGEPALPPDPAAVAPPVNPTVATSVFDATAFLYTGANPIQTGVAAGTIEAKRVVVVRGKVKRLDGFPLPGVTVSVLNHPEFGQTLSRADGMFDLVINGGSVLTLNYAKSGLLPAQRQIEAPWREFVIAPDAILVSLDAAVTTVDLTAPVIQAARGSVVTDAAGSRQATLLFAPGTTATMTLPGGGTQPLATLHVRATEYTVGATGPQAMPAQLPPTSIYTYAAELSVDEALAAGATAVQFNQPVIYYLENFLNFPVGKAVPAGFYDRGLGRWVASENGQVIKILSIAGGAANVDTDGDAVADAGLGLTLAERQQLATLYPAGSTLWRVPVTHFSPLDLNVFWRLLKKVTALFAPTTKPEIPCGEDEQEGSIIRCQTQSLGETVNLTGTPLRLHYSSDRVRGRLEAYSLKIPVSGATLPTGLRRIEVQVALAGKETVFTFPPVANQTFTFTWDGRDVYGRTLQGKQPVYVILAYYTDATYGLSDPGTQRAFAQFPTGTVIAGPSGPYNEQVILQYYRENIGALEAPPSDLGGWTLSEHHRYDPSGRVLSLGTGERLVAHPASNAITTVAGTGIAGFGGDNGPALQTQFNQPSDVLPAPDGSLYIADNFNHRVRKIDPNGIITTVAGTGVAGYSGDNGPAILAQLFNPNHLALAPDGTLYISDALNNRVRKVDANGIITTVAGTGVAGFSGDGGPATAAQLNITHGLNIGQDGSLYIADRSNHRIRRVAPNGIITTVAGTGIAGFGGDNGPATAAQLNFPGGVVQASDGALYLTDQVNSRIRRIAVDGTITTVAGTGVVGYTGDGGPATAAQLNNPHKLAVNRDGTIDFPDQNNHVVRRISPTGIISTIAGTGTPGFSGELGPATAAQVQFPNGFNLAPDGTLYVADQFNHRIRRITLTLPRFNPGDLIVPDGTGSALYVFDAAGRHLRTLDALTGGPRYQFMYDGSGRLTTITDAGGKVTTVERDGAGNPTAIVAPGGQRTGLTLHGDGYLAAVANPNNERTTLTYQQDGLLATLTDPKGQMHTYTYDTLGRLIKDEDPATGFTALTRMDLPTSWTVTLTTALNRATSYQVDLLPTGDLRRINTAPSGLATDTLIRTDGTTTVTAPDGTITTPVQGPDPRWGMLAPILKSLTVQTPLGLTSTLTTTRATTLTNPNDPLSLATQTDTLVINGRTYTSIFNQTAKTITTTTPAARTSSVALDVKGRVVQEQVTGLEAVAYTYDSLGRLSTITQGTGVDARTSILNYDAANRLTSIADPLNRTVGFAYDQADRITTQTLPDLRQIGYAYDGNGNVTSITPPGKPAHAFSYTPVDLESTYNPPDAGFSPRNTQYTYNLDRQLTLVTRPDGQTIQLGYEPTGGRLSTLTLPGPQTITYAYEPTKGTLSSVTAPGSTLSYTYDGSLLKSTTWAGTVAGSISRNYDTNFRITSQSINGANTATFGYDNDSLLTSAGGETITRQANNGLISGTTLGVATDSRTYNSFGELATYTANVSGSPVFSTTFTRDKLGRITQKVETIGGLTDTYDYIYDLAGRLQEVKKNGGTLATYAYDSNGNRLSRTDSFGPINGTYDAQDRQLTYGNLAFTYTTNGELLTKTISGQTTSYVYDVLGNLKSVTLPDSTLIEYVVDGQNRRIGKKVNGTLTKGFLYQNQLNPVAELDGTGAIVSRFVYGTKANAPDFMIKAGGTYRIISDHLGSPRLIINTADGTVAQRMDYDEFGNVTQDNNPGFQPFGFAGGVYDAQTGLVRFGARDYDAVTGRWTTKDTIINYPDEQINLYAYVVNDPLNWVDPWGLMKLPNDPSGLPPGWTSDPGHKDPNGQRFRDPSGRPLDWHPGRPSEPGWRGKDHWHDPDNFGKKHLPPGTQVPDPAQPPRRPIPPPLPLPSIICPVPFITNPCLFDPDLCQGGGKPEA